MCSTVLLYSLEREVTMERKRKSDIISEIMNRYQDEMNDDEMLDVLAFLSVIVMHNMKEKDPSIMLDRVVSYWVKTMSVLTQSFTVTPPNGEPPEA